MTTSNYPRGRQTKIRLAYQSAFATQAASGFQELNTYTHAFNTNRALQDDDVLGAGFFNLVDARAPAPGLEEAEASLSVPFDLAQLGYWLKAALGAPVTTGTTTKTHVFTTGATTLPTLTLERELAASQLEALIGGVVKTAKFDFSPAAGFRQLDLTLGGRQVLAPYTSSIAGSPTVQTLANRIPASIGSIKQGGTVLGLITDGSLTLTNDFEMDRYVGDRLRSAVGLNSIAAELAFTARYDTDALRSLANLNAATGIPNSVAISIEYVVSASLKLVLDLPAVRYDPVSIAVQNGNTFTQSFKGRCEATSSAPLMTATLTNAFAGY
jgi:hypothetical protein